jgi:DNA-binding XRE family transcriptional regulator
MDYNTELFKSTIKFLNADAKTIIREGLLIAGFSKDQVKNFYLGRTSIPNVIIDLVNELIHVAINNMFSRILITDVELTIKTLNMEKTTVKIERAKAQLTQQELADKANINISTLKKIESAKFTICRLGTAYAIAYALGKEPADFSEFKNMVPTYESNSENSQQSH